MLSGCQGHMAGGRVCICHYCSDCMFLPYEAALSSQNETCPLVPGFSEHASSSPPPYPIQVGISCSAIPPLYHPPTFCGMFPSFPWLYLWFQFYGLLQYTQLHEQVHSQLHEGSRSCPSSLPSMAWDMVDTQEIFLKWVYKLLFAMYHTGQKVTDALRDSAVFELWATHF